MRRTIELLPALGLTVAWIVPLHFPPWVTWHSEVPVFVGVLLAAFAAVCGAIGGRGVAARLSVPTVTWALVALGALVAVQAAVGLIRFAGDAWTILLYLGLCIGAFQLGHWQVGARRFEAADRLAWTLLAAGLGCTVVALVQALDIWSDCVWITRTPTLRRSGSNLGQPNQMATMVLMAAASAAYLFERSRLRRWVAAVAAGTLAIGLATTESRTGLLAMAALGLWWFCRGYESRLRVWAVGLTVAAAIAGYLVWPPFIEWFHAASGLGATAGHVNTDVGLRAIVWPQLVEAIGHRPWLGWGARQTSSALSSVVGGHPVSEPYTYAHNIVLESLIAFGIPLTLMLVAAAIIWFRRRWHARCSQIGWYCIALWVPLLIHALLEFPYSYAYMLAPAMFALGLLEASPEGPPARQFPALLLASMFAFTAAIGVWSVLDYVKVEEDFRIARFEALRVGATPPSYVRPEIHLLTQFAAMTAVARIVPQPNMASAQIELARDVAARFPWPALQSRFALALALNGQTAAARNELRVIRAMHGDRTLQGILQDWRKLLNQYPQLSALAVVAPPPVEIAAH